MTKPEWSNFIALLNREVVPALGCTEPITISLATARAVQELGTAPERITVLVSGNLLKNGMGVGVPGTGMTGLDIAAAVGATGGNAELSLEVLRDLTEEQIAAGKQMLTEKRVKVALAETAELLLADVTVFAGNDCARCVIAREHTAVVLVEKNGTEVFSAPWPGEEAGDTEWPLTMERIHDFAVNAPFETISFILEAARLNEAIAAEGMSREWGLKVGRSMEEDIQQGLRADDIASFAIKMAAAASDARMDGIMLPVMSNSGSGNQGITATVPVLAFARRLNADDEKLARALIMSHLTAIHLKHHLGRLSALCGAILAATGSSCGIVMLLGGGMREIGFAIKNMVGNIAGMICDGAKTSCALKVASAVEAGIQAALLARKGTSVSGKEGIVDDDLEVSIQNLGRLGTSGMAETDKVILDIMVSKK
ncbi:L-serine ammonia-lyase, iron-sulfur-dependent, subunit alpha [Desulfovibrio mangrovi]|uniref:L-cysteine desulfidase family protein n=1 Tax=Desulfovibrio mangrovi TaxID=2976983 RepID=UPI002244FEF3|nr:L-serine ammonia-lyase, iron-sulfur-dependent, subunit alpha [Desulfovibrio mangrovi]UZP67078.1 L-serine ammonia-lyase, iron-sulfur-dependent, subunit alpha [Desulfovibrio mangrovi]